METCWNVTIKDTSSIIKYLPYADGETQGWTGVFSGGNQAINGVTVGTGDSQHVTAGSQSSAEIVFNGESQTGGNPKWLNKYFAQVRPSTSMVQLREICSMRSSLMVRSLLGNPTGGSWPRSRGCRVNANTPFYSAPSLRLQEITWHCSPPLLLSELA